MLRTAHAYKQQTQTTGRRIDGMTRQEACLHYQRKVMLLARRLSERLPRDSELGLDDLVSYGAIGLLEAFDRYDGARNIQFSTYAEYRIRGAMLDALRSNDTFSRRRRQLAKRIRVAVDEVRQTEGREPNPQEVADRLGIDLEEYWHAVDRVAPISMVSLDGSAPTDDEEGRTLLEQIENPHSPLPDHDLDVSDLRDQLKLAVRALPERERHCVLMYYGKELSLAEIAEVYSVTPSRISQILTAARSRLRKKLSVTVDVNDLSILAG